MEAKNNPLGSSVASTLLGKPGQSVRPRRVRFWRSLSGSSDSYLGLFPAKYEEVTASETVMAILYLMQEILQSQTMPFHRTVEREVCKKEKEFIGKS
jgi:hypothetical protein